MARRRNERPAKKFGTPLYCAVWPKGDYAFVGGGGGKSSSGIANKIVTVHSENGQISGAAAGSVTLQDAPMRLALQPQETTLAVALGDGGILKFSIARDTDGVPVLQQLQGKAEQEFAKIGIVECMAFSSDGRVLGVSTADGSLTFYDWQTGRALNVLRAEHGVSSTIRDLCFSPAHKDNVLAAVADNGTCSLWAWEQRLQITTLDLPKELKGGAFSKARWSQDSTATLYTVVNLSVREEGHLLLYKQDEEGELQLQRQSLLCRKKVSAFDLSRSGRMCGTGTMDGDAAIFSLPSGKRLKQSPDAHMVFVTAVAFSKGEDSLLSASADASAWLTGMPAQRGARVSSIATVTLLMLVLVLCAVAAAFLTGLDAQILAALERIGVKQAAHTEL